MDLGCSWFRTLFRVGSGLLCFIESWFIIFSEGLARKFIYDWLKLYLWWLACLLVGWLAGLLPCLLPQLLACCLAGLLACMQSGSCSGLRAWLACLLAPLPLCLLAGLAGLAGLPACLLGRLLPCSVAQLLACLLACWLHCERMIGEKNPRGRGKNKNSAPPRIVVIFTEHSPPLLSFHHISIHKYR